VSRAKNTARNLRFIHTAISFLPHHPATSRCRSIVSRRLLRVFGRISYYYYAVVNLKDKVKRGTREVGVAGASSAVGGNRGGKVVNYSWRTACIYTHCCAVYIIIHTNSDGNNNNNNGAASVSRVIIIMMS